MDSVEGLYRVRTASGSTYVIDLTHNRLRRVPNSEVEDSAVLRQDDSFIPILSLVELSVGLPFEIVIDLRVDGVSLTTRRSTTVVSIDAIGEAEADV